MVNIFPLCLPYISEIEPPVLERLLFNLRRKKAYLAIGNTAIIASILAIVVIIALIGYAADSPRNDSISGQTYLVGKIEIDGSSTVFPITEAISEEFWVTQPNIRVNVGVSGTGGGFKRFINGETDITDASRPIKPSEIEELRENGIDFIELQIALDGLSIVVNPSNTWVDYLTVEELKIIWEPESRVEKWNDIRSNWPDKPINLYGPGTDSGTFDYFTEVIVGEEDASRADFTASEDDNVLIQGIAGDTNALGYFGFAYYAENMEILKIVPVDSGNGPVTPSDETINSGEYDVLSRSLFIYVKTKSLQRSEVKAFLEFYMENAIHLVKEIGYTPLPESIILENLMLLKNS